MSGYHRVVVRAPAETVTQSSLALPHIHSLHPFPFMKAVVHVKKDGKWYVATDLVTHIADQGRTRDTAIRNLTKGLREHDEVMIDLALRKRGTKAPFTRPGAAPSPRGRSRSR